MLPRRVGTCALVLADTLTNCRQFVRGSALLSHRTPRDAVGVYGPASWSRDTIRCWQRSNWITPYIAPGIWDLPKDLFDDGAARRNEDAKLIICVITLHVTQPMWPQHSSIPDKRADGRTDNLRCNTACPVRATRGKKVHAYREECISDADIWGASETIHHYVLQCDNEVTRHVTAMSQSHGIDHIRWRMYRVTTRCWEISAEWKKETCRIYTMHRLKDIS